MLTVPAAKASTDKKQRKGEEQADGASLAVVTDQGDIDRTTLRAAIFGVRLINLLIVILSRPLSEDLLGQLKIVGENFEDNAADSLGVKPVDPDQILVLKKAGDTATFESGLQQSR